MPSADGVRQVLPLFGGLSVFVGLSCENVVFFSSHIGYICFKNSPNLFRFKSFPV